MNIKVCAAITAGIAMFGMAGLAYGDDAQDPRFCREIRAEKIGQMVQIEATQVTDTNDNCTSPVAFCSAGTIDGNFGLDGTTFFSVDGVASTPAQAPGTSSYTGIYTIITRRGTLTLRETGISYPRAGNPEGGVLASIAEVQSGTGRYATTRGILFFHGHNGRGRPSNVAVSGTLCTMPPE